MPSPFPGMDPYIENPEVWSDFHGRLPEQISAELNAVVQPRYVARLTPRVTYDVVEISQRRSVRPDVGVWQPRCPAGQTGEGGIAIAEAPAESLIPMEVPLELYTVEVLEVDTLRLVTAIEILSPVNKRPGHEAYYDYQHKRRRIWRSTAHLMEIDLLRGGTRPPLEAPVPPAPYYVTLSRENRRPHVEVWPIQLADPLPTLPVPLLEPDPDVPLDLGKAVAAVYERGGYTVLIDYHQPPPSPPLSDADAVWLDDYLRAAGAR